jgi:protein-L-isoaspartate(D-aspartate) O-methyltransferase
VIERLGKNNKAEQMVKNQLTPRGIRNERILSIMSKLPREKFINSIEFNPKQDPYDDNPIAIGYGQTISQPYMVALMSECLDLHGHEKILEIGTGSGYQTAVLAELAGEVYTIERIPFLYERARQTLLNLGYANINFKLGDGSEGWSEMAPFERILVAAAAPAMPRTLRNQLQDGGVMVIPIGDYKAFQKLIILQRAENRYFIKQSIGCRFVPLVGKEGFKNIL